MTIRPMLDPRYTGEHYPWQSVSADRIAEAVKLCETFELEVNENDNNRRGRHEWWGGASYLGYRVEATGQHYLHPMFMKAEELEDFDTLSGFDYIKEGSLLYKLLNVTDAPPGMTPRQLLDLIRAD